MVNWILTMTQWASDVSPSDWFGVAKAVNTLFNS